MVIAERLDDYGKGAWIALMVLSFIIFWPLGLAMLIYMSCSGRMAAWKQEARAWKQEMRAMKQDIRGRYRSGGGCGWGGGDRDTRRSTSGNVAFDEYRRETLQRLEDEQREFEDYLDRLRAAKDKSEFDQFMAERRGNPGPLVA